MNEIVAAGQQAIWLVLVFSAWPVALATVIGLVIGAAQTIFQLQEQTLPFGVKLFGVGLCLYIGSGWGGHALLTWSLHLMQFALHPARP